MDHLYWQSLLVELLATVTHDSHVTVTNALALATLGGNLCRATQGGQGKS
jgi:hypothetical protein